MDTKKEAKKYLNKYFKAQYLKETDDEYKDLVKLLNRAIKEQDEQLICNDFNPEIGFPTGNGKCRTCGKYHHENLQDNKNLIK